MAVHKTPSGMFNVYDEGDEPARGSLTVPGDGLNNNAIVADCIFAEHNTDGTHKTDIIDGENIKSTAFDGVTLEKNVSTQKAGVKDGGIGVSQLATDAVETAKIKDANVTHAKLADDAVETHNIKDANVTAAKLADLAVIAGKILGSGAGKAVDNITIGLNGSNELEVKDGGIDTDQIADLAVTAEKLGLEIYMALVNQSGTSAPVFTPILDTLTGGAGWANYFSGTGHYTCYCHGSLVENKFVCLILNGANLGHIVASQYYSYGSFANAIEIWTSNTADAAANDILNNAMMLIINVPA